ncbi:MAG: MBL fold metallo-hydrolase [Bacilli bacterium]|nr:MBL fold metallo-hydrolase [Bacilli bacterium]
MRVSVLASGSKGNSTLIKTKDYNILIDAGMTLNYLENKLRKNEVLLKDIDYIFITHTHFDHIAALNNLVKKYHPTIILTEKMLNDLDFLKEYEYILLLNDDLYIDNLVIETISTSHDSSDSKAYIITEKDTSIVILTDTGYLNHKYFTKLKNKNIYIFESNYDHEMLMYGKYPKWLQKRINSDEGHLSNDMASFYLCKLIGPNTKKIVLAHLSEENNTEAAALECLNNKLKENNIKFNNIIVAKQREATELIKV